MTEKSEVKDKGGFGYPLLGDVAHGSTVVVAKNRAELMYIIEWAKSKNKIVSEWMEKVDKFPYCLALHNKIVGWTDLMDRALYYKPFTEFVGDVA